MPLYEYECEACGHRFEVIQKFSDPLADTCPKCGSKVHKLFSSPAIQFKGSGFYITDYARKDHVPSSKAGGSDSAGSSDKSEKSEKADKAEKSDKSEKSGQGDTSAKADKSTDKGSSSSESSPAASTTPTGKDS